jgi:hypothetical protein
LSQTPRPTSAVNSPFGHHEPTVFHVDVPALPVGFHQATLRCHALWDHRSRHTHARATAVGWTAFFGRSERSEKAEET